MTRLQALQLMRDGKKVTHRYFSSTEYLHRVDGKIMTEDGYYFGDMFYSQLMFVDGWREFK